MAELLAENKAKNKIELLVKITAWTAMIIFAAHAGTRMVAAGDTWVAMACGRHFANHGVDTVEPFSYKSHEAGPTEKELEKFPEWSRSFIKRIHPTGWINQNWLTQVVFYRLTTTFGSEEEPAYNLLVVWKFLLNFIVIICLYYTSRLLGAGKLISAVSICAAMFISRSFIDIRPAVYSNMLVPIFVYILMLAMHKKPAYIYLIIPLITYWSNVHGGYLYVFMILVPFWVINFGVKWFKISWIDPVPNGLLKHTFICGVLSFAAMVVFNPYHLTNLTHTFIITVSEHAQEWKNVNEWHGAFNLDNPVGDSKPFVVMFIVSLLLIIFWFGIWLLKPKAESKTARKEIEQGYKWCKMPACMIFIALFTMAMAVSSRRFIPISAYTMAPLLALMLSQMQQMISARKNLKLNRKFVPTFFSQATIKKASLAILSISVILGVFWTIKFYKIYLGPWPIDSKKTSVFMRMTASYAKPFEACQFIRENKLSGNMLNYWTEGGFLAFHQEPDEQTGHIPLKFFMDGRAQAAYDIETFHEYNIDILAGGELGRELVRQANAARKPLSAFPEQFNRLSQYLDDKLAEYDVWLILMPLSQQRGLFMRTISSRPNWQMVYLDHSQIILVNINTEKGQQLRRGLFDGTAIYPDQSYRNTLLAAYRTSADPEGAFELLKGAYEKHYSTAAMTQIINIGSNPDMQQTVYDFCRAVVSDFLSYKEEYKRHHGFAERQSNAILALNFLSQTSQQREPERTAAYAQLLDDINSQRKQMLKKYNW